MKPRKTELLIGITGRICSGKRTLAEFIQPRRDKTKIICFEETFKTEVMFSKIIESMQKEGLPASVLDMNERQELRLTEIVLDAFKSCHNEKANLPEMQKIFENWDEPFIICPVINTY